MGIPHVLRSIRMAAPLTDDGPAVTAERCPGRRGWLWLLAALAVAAAVHAPSLEIGFLGDDFEWWLAARTAIEQPQRLITAYGGFRPANLWTMVLDYLAYGTDPLGPHLTSILLHLACGAVFWLVLRRFDFGAAAASGIACLWLCSPYSLKPAQSLCERFQPLLLLVWLGLVLVWPRAGVPWSRARLGVVVGLSGFSALVKETWVVLPGLVLCFELCLHRVRWQRALRSAAIAAVAVAVYVALYALSPPIAASYYASSPAPAAKVLHGWAVFLGLTPLEPSSTQLGWAEGVAALVIAVLAWAGWRRRCVVTGIGLALYLLPWLPILTVGFLVTRYTYIPLVGFLLVVAAAGRALLAVVPGRWAPVGATMLVAVGALFFGTGLRWLGGDMVDAGRRDEAHRRLLAEARAFGDRLPHDRLILGVRLERESPNRILLDRIEGVPKAYYERTHHPYALIKWAPLFSYVLDPAGGPLYESARVAGDEPFAVVGHRSGGFMLLPPGGDTPAAAAEHWRGRGGFVEALRALEDR